MVVIGVVDQVGISDICRCLSCDSLGTQVLTLLAWLLLLLLLDVGCWMLLVVVAGDGGGVCGHAFLAIFRWTTSQFDSQIGLKDCQYTCILGGGFIWGRFPS